MQSQLVKGIGVTVAGVALGWAANALTLVGRMDAVEKAVARLEAQIGRLLDQRQAIPPRPMPAAPATPAPQVVHRTP
jgi:hypothetical protein